MNKTTLVAMIFAVFGATALAWHTVPALAEDAHQSPAHVSEKPPCDKHDKHKHDKADCEKCRKGQHCDKSSCTMKKLMKAADRLEIEDKKDGVTIKFVSEDKDTVERMHKMAEIMRLKAELKEE